MLKVSCKTRKWQDKSGNDRYTTDIIVNEMQMLGSRSGGSSGYSGGDSPSRSSAPPSAPPQAAPAADDFDDDIPF